MTRRKHPIRERLWREWCFFLAAFSHFRIRLLLMLLVLAGGTIGFLTLEPEARHSPERAVYYTWLLVFGEPPEQFPSSRWLQAIFFIVPVLGLTLIIEGIVDFAWLLRDRRRNEKGWSTVMANSYKNHIVLVGLGRLGYKTYQLLLQLGEQVVVIERSKENQFLEEVRRDGGPLFIGDARREAVLGDANIAAARSIILATTDDLANLEIGLDARLANPHIRVVLRMFDQNMADKVRDGFHVHVAMSQSAISAPAFAMAAVEPGTLNSLMVNDEVIGIQRWEILAGGPLCNHTVGSVLAKYRCSVIERKPIRPPSGKQLFPPPETALEPGDVLMVQGSLDTLRSLRKLADN